MNVLDWRGPEFLQLYISLLLVSIAAAFLLRYLLRGPGGLLPRSAIPELHPFEVAYLADGPRGVTDAAIAALIQRGSIEVARGRPELVASSVRPINVTPLEQAVFDAVRTGDGKIGPIRKSTRKITASVSTRVRALGFALTGPQNVAARLFPALLVLSVLALGVMKLNVGYLRGRSVEFLFALCAVTLFVGLAFAGKSPIRTRRGSRLLDRFRRDNAALKTTAAKAPAGMASTDMLMAFALFGSSTFIAGEMSDLHQILQPPSAGGSGCGSGSSGCGSGCGGGGCGGCGGD